MRGAAEFVKARFNYPIVAAEIGVEQGINAAEMVQKMQIERLYTIDPYVEYTDYLGGLCPQYIQDQVYNTMFKNLSPHFDKIVLITKDSINAVKLFSDEFFDFVYIDGNHNYASVKLDAELWFRKVKKGGILSGHDWDGRDITSQQVTDAVRDFVKENNLKLMVFPEPGLGGRPGMGDWAIIR